MDGFYIAKFQKIQHGERKVDDEEKPKKEGLSKQEKKEKREKKKEKKEAYK
jgi:hypothetical protein